MPNSNTNPAIEITVRPFNFGSFQNVATTTGTSTAGSSTTLFYSSIFLPGNCTISSIKVLLGTGGNGNIVGSLHKLDGTLLGSTTVAASGTTATTQTLTLTTPVQVVGPGHILIGIILANASDSIRTIPAVFDAGSNPMTGSVTVAANTPASFTPSTTTFTADKGPIVSVG